MNKNKKFLKEELVRYEEYLQNETPGTDEYEEIKDSYLSIYKELYSKKNVWDIVIDCLKTIILKLFQDNQTLLK